MSCNYYFEKWKKTLIKLDELIRLDIAYQETKAHDKKWCDAAQRLTGVLGKYMFIYNETADCCRHNLQVQKAEYIRAIIKAIVSRILELKDQIRKLVGSEYQFMGHGLIKHKLTTYEVLLSDVFANNERNENVKTLVSESIKKATDRKLNSMNVTEPAEPVETVSQKVNWWDKDNDSEDTNVSHEGINVMAVYELKKKEDLTFEALETKKMATVIQTHVKTKKVLLKVRYEKLKRETWQKELNGTLRPPARREIREKSAKIMQQFFRAYFEIKRRRLKEFKRDEVLGIRLCEKLCQKYKENDNEDLTKTYIEKFNEYQKQCNENYVKIKQKYIERRYDIIENDIREEIMYWFRKWFDEASFIHDIPKEIDGGSILIVKEEIPSPKVWLEKYKAYLDNKRANKNKTAIQLKYEKLQAKNEKLIQKRAEHLQKKMEEQILKKMMKNPKFHPGYHYPPSKKITNLIQTVEDYKTQWSKLDLLEEPSVKQKAVIDIDINNAYMDAKIEIRKSVDVAMRETFKVLFKALREDYQRNGEEMPQQVKEKKRRRKKPRKNAMDVCDNIADKLENLAHRGFLKEYPQIKIDDFIGDPNFAGDDLQCQLKIAEAFGGETKALWWDRCRELSHGYHRTLLVGSKGSGKTTLVHIIASMNDAILYQIDPAWVPEELLSAIYLQELATTIAECARATQPSVIYIKHLHRLYYTKPPPGEDKDNLSLVKRYFLRKLMKKIHKSDKVIIVGTCIDPWLTRSKQMLKHFPNIVLLPNTNYSTVTILLNNWLLDNHVVPRDLDVQSLAHVLQGYSFGYIKEILNKFLTAERTLKIAASGLHPHDIYKCFLDGEEEKVEYNKYLKWYNNNSHWAKKAKKILEDQQEFQLVVQKWQQKEKKRNPIVPDVITNTNS